MSAHHGAGSGRIETSKGGKERETRAPTAELVTVYCLINPLRLTPHMDCLRI